MAIVRRGDGRRELRIVAHGCQELTPTSTTSRHHLTYPHDLVRRRPFWTLNVDTLVTSIVSAWSRSASCGGSRAGRPRASRQAQAFVELAVDFVDDQVKGIYHGDRTFVAPLALTMFVWVLLHERDGLPAGRHHRAGSTRTCFASTPGAACPRPT